MVSTKKQLFAATFDQRKTYAYPGLGLVWSVPDQVEVLPMGQVKQERIFLCVCLFRCFFVGCFFEKKIK
jgi:hypothetical protein